ncbi:MAG: hypothetical protein AAF622_20890 [Cyanobacteria bacterium P01_C01_bin.147]
MTGGGCATARSALYLATLVAVRHNPLLRTMYSDPQSGQKGRRLGEKHAQCT